MEFISRLRPFDLAVGLLFLLTNLIACSFAVAQEGASKQFATPLMQVDEVKRGMKGYGRTVLEGTELVRFEVEILGVQRNVVPGRDMILSRLSGAGLEESGVIAGMSGSPVYLDGKLLGAVAYAWPFAKQPIAGITPFIQMRDSAAQPKESAFVSASTVDYDGSYQVAELNWPTQDAFTAITESSFATVKPVAASFGGMKPIAMPLAASGLGPQTLEQLQAHFKPFGMMPMAAGAGQTDQESLSAKIEPGSVMACGLVTGDVDITGIGTTTHVEGDRVWGWGHPMMSSGRCRYLLRSGHIHLVNSKLNISTKMGSALDILGVVDADVGSCIAGQLGQEPDMVPVEIDIRESMSDTQHTFNVQIVRQPELLGSLVATVLSNSVEDLGKLPSELTVKLDASIEVEGIEPITMRDTFSGPSVAGNRGLSRLFGTLAVVTNALSQNPFGMAPIERIRCKAEILDQRTSARIESVRLHQQTYAPGEELVATVTLRPFKQDAVQQQIRVRLPKNLTKGSYALTVCDVGNHLRERFREQPQLLNARDVAGVAEAYRQQLTDSHCGLYVRIPLPEEGLAMQGVHLPQLPASVRSVLGTTSGMKHETIRRSLVHCEELPWIVEGGTTLNFVVDPQRGVSLSRR